jgi:hypothetical protein
MQLEVGPRFLLGAVSAAVFLIAGPVAEAAVRSTPSRTYVTNGPVFTVAPTKKATYIGGAFTEVGPRTGPGVGIDSSTGKSTGLAQVAGGGVDTVARDGSGGYYIGGYFTHVGGLPRRNLAHILADGSVDPGFKPDPSGEIRALTVSGSTVYVGGYFDHIGGQARNNIAALDSATGKATAWNPNPDPNQSVRALAVSGSTIYAGGGFHYIGGQAREGLAALDRTTGEATAWNPNSNGDVAALAVSGPTVYIGGGFTQIGGEARNHIAALDADTGAATAWNPDVTNSLFPCGSPGHPPFPIPRECGSGAVTALAITGTTVYAGGSFDRVGGEARNRLAAIDRTTGDPTAWSPNPNVDGNPGAVITALAVSGATVYTGGWFTAIGGEARNNLAALDRTTGGATAWNPRPNLDRADGPTINALAVSGSTVYAGGTFRSIGVKTRNHIAALDTATGRATAWNPDADGPITHLSALGGSTVYAGGWFTTIGGEDRLNLAGLDTTTGDATAFDPQPRVNAHITALAASGKFVFVAGSVPGIAGQPVYFLTQVYKTDGRVRNSSEKWNPDPDGAVTALAFSGPTVLAGGTFTTIGGEARNHVAALDRRTAAATDWNPNPNGTVNALAVRTAATSTVTTVYVGGQFTTVGGQNRNNLAALNGATGEATRWNPNSNGDVSALAVTGLRIDDSSSPPTSSADTIYAGGGFTRVGGKVRNNLAALDGTSGQATTWGPGVAGAKGPGFTSPYAVAIYSLAFGPDRSLWTGGGFTSFRTTPQAGIAEFKPTP